MAKNYTNISIAVVKVEKDDKKFATAVNAELDTIRDTGNTIADVDYHITAAYTNDGYHTLHYTAVIEYFPKDKWADGRY